MNPDEGELRPQLQDRFGLCVQLSNHYSIDERIEIVKLREAFDQSPDAFVEQYTQQQTALVEQVQAAKQRLLTIHCASDMRKAIAERCHDANVDGMRADIVWYRAALAHAAWQGRDSIKLSDIDAVEPLVLQHRQNGSVPSPQPPPPPPPPFSRPPAPQSNETPQPSPQKPPQSQAPIGENNTEGQPESSDSDWGGMPPQQQTSQRINSVPLSKTIKSPQVTAALGASKLLAGKQKGGHLGGTRNGAQEASGVNWFATFAANLSQKDAVKHWQWKYKKARTGRQVLHLVLLDTSASTLAGQAFAKSKGVVLQIAEQAYLLREQLAVMSFGNEQVTWLLPQVRAPKQLTPLLNQTPAGGGTPIYDVLHQAQQYLLGVRRQFPEVAIKTYLLTDGRTTQSLEGLHLTGHCTLIDTEQSTVKRGRAKAIAKVLGADYFSLNTAGIHS